MKILEASEENLDEMVAILRAGDILALPTDTVYGLAVVARIPGAVKKIFQAKGRPAETPIALLVGDIKQAQSVTGIWPSFALRIAARYWPGPITMVLQRAPGFDVYLGESKGTVGVRWPDAPVVTALAKLLGPLATTSANLHGAPPCRTAQEIAELFEDKGVSAVVDGGELSGIPSTVVDCTSLDMRLIREGAVSFSELEQLYEENYA